MVFSYGNLITLVVVLLILLVYRALDRNNRSLEKLKRFSDKITANMTALVEERTAQVRDLGLELQASLQTGKEILVQARGVEELLQDRSADIEQIEKRFADYDKALAELTSMSARVDKNLLRIRDESEFVDGLGRRIEESAVRLGALEHRVPEIEEGLSTRVTKALSDIQDRMVGVLDARVASLTRALQASEGKVKDFSAYLARLESREEQAGKERLAGYAKALDSFDAGLRGKIAEAVRRAETLEDEIFTRLSARIQTDEASVTRGMEAIELRLGDYQGDVDYRVKSLEEAAHDVDALRASLAETVERAAAGVRTEMKSLGAELVAGWTSEVAAASATREQLRTGMAEIESDLAGLKTRSHQDMEKNLSLFEDEFFADLRARSAAMLEKVAAWQDAMEKRAREFETGLKAQVGAAEDSLGALRETLRGDMDRVKRDALVSYEKDVAAVRDTLEAGTRKMRREIETGLAELASGLELGRRELAEHIDSSRVEVTAWEGTTRQQLAETEAAIAERVAVLSVDSASSIGALKDSFAAQKDELIVATTEERLALRKELAAMAETVAAQRSGLEKTTEQAMESLRTELEGYQAETQKRVREMQAEVDGKLKEHRQLLGDAREKAGVLQERLLARVEESLEVGRRKVAEQLEASRVEVTAWEGKARQQLAETQAAIDQAEAAVRERTAVLSADSAASIGALKESFVSQKDELIAATNEERLALRRELGVMGDTVAAQRDELTRTVEGAMASLRAQLDGSQAEMQKRVRDMQAEVDGKLKEHRQLLGDAREKAGVLQEKLFAKVEESLGAGRRELAEHIDASRAEVAAWEEKAREQLAETEAAIADRVAALSADSTSSIDAVQESFAAQKDEMIAATNEQRLAMRRDLVALGESVAAHRDELKKATDAVKESLTTQVDVFQAETQKRLRDLQAEVDGQLKEQRRLAGDSREKAESLQERLLGKVEEGLEAGRRDLAEQIDAARAEVTTWEGKAKQQLAQAEASIAEKVAALSAASATSIGAVQESFAAQAEELVTAADQERQALRKELAALAESVVVHRQELSKSTEAATESVRVQIEAFQAETQKRVRDMQADVDGTMKEHRQLLGEAREKAEALQEKLFGKVEESHRVLASSVGEIDKRVKGFLSQTRLFERADSLKAALEGTIEDMKKEMATLNLERTEIVELEVQITKTRKVADEVSAKLTRFLTEKRRIEDMDGDFKKIITLSRDVDLKLDTLSASSDALQQIQAKVRQFEEMGKAVEGGFERLEKKKEIISVTADGVDRTFQRLEGVEKALAEADRAADVLTSKVGTLKDDYEALAANKKNADAAMETVGRLGGVMAELEERLEKAQSAREWMARTETRFEEIGRQAQEQVRLMESIVKAETKKDKADRGAPPLDKRETVVKLSHQGWSVVEISRVTQLSRGEVELILELAPKV